MRDDLVVGERARRGPRTPLLVLLALVGLAAVVGLYALAPEGEHAPEGASVDTDGAVTSTSAGRPAVTQPPPPLRSFGPAPLVFGASFAEPTGGCDDAEAFRADVEFYSPEQGQLFVRPAHGDELPEAEGTIAEDGTFEAASDGDVVEWKGRLTAVGGTATLRSTRDGCTAVHAVRLSLKS